MQTMTALVRISGNLAMTVRVRNVTPGEAWLLMNIHDADTKDVFENAQLTADVTRSKTEERDRLLRQYSEQEKLVNTLFPGRSAHDIPDRFAELEGVPLEVAGVVAPPPKGEPEVATLEEGAVYVGKSEPLSDEQMRATLLGGKKK
jgi:hypothetical protein